MFEKLHDSGGGELTGLPCPDHAAERHRRLADLGPLPGSPAEASDAARAAAHHRDLARRFC